ncbi:MAG: hypothetical protein MZV49_27040 [Rhodopseudomonas palustris]|nr:hypothetical protein [Rhodopseudomonas palustris]
MKSPLLGHSYDFGTTHLRAGNLRDGQLLADEKHPLWGNDFSFICNSLFAWQITMGTIATARFCQAKRAIADPGG